MKIIVDKLPTKPEDCLFAVRNTHYGCFICSLYENISGKPKNVHCICRDTSKCECLKEMNE